MSLWKEGFQAFHPDLDLFLSADLDRKGVFAPTGDRVLIYVTTDDFLMSEIQEQRDKFGYAPRLTPVFIEMLAIVVHKDNPVEFMTLSQIDAIFSRDRLTNKGRVSIQEWGQVGVEGEWKRRPIAVHGREVLRAVRFSKSSRSFLLPTPVAAYRGDDSRRTMRSFLAKNKRPNCESYRAGKRTVVDSTINGHASTRRHGFLTDLQLASVDCRKLAGPRVLPRHTKPLGPTSRDVAAPSTPGSSRMPDQPSIPVPLMRDRRLQRVAALLARGNIRLRRSNA